MDKYIPNGTPLSDREREILVVLIEECSEVIQAASKLIRFGKENTLDSEVPNTVILSQEIGDLRYMLTMVRDAKLTDVEIEILSQGRKHDRMRWFMQSPA